MAIQGKLEGDQLCLEEIVDFVSTVTGALGKKITIPTDQLPQICIKNAEFTIAPRAVRIGDLEYEKGFKISGDVTIFPPKQLAKIDNKLLFAGRGVFELRDTGLVAEGYLNEQHIGLLKISGAGPDKNYNTPDDGPYFVLSATPEKQEFVLSGLVELGDLYKKQTDIKLTKTEALFNFEDKIKNLLDSKVFGRASLLDLDVQLEIDVTASFNEYFKERFNRVLSTAQEKIKQLLQTLGHLEKDISVREARIVELENAMRTKTDAVQSALNSVQSVLAQELAKIDPQAAQTQKDLDDAVKKVEEAYKNLDHVRRDRDLARDRINKVQGLEKLNPELLGTLAGLELAVSGAEAALNAARDTLNTLIRKLATLYYQIGKDVLQGASQAATLIKGVLANPTQLTNTIELAQLGAELAGLKVARSSILIAKDLPLALLEKLKDIANKVADILKIEKVYYKGSLSQLLKGKYPKFMLDITTFGKRRALDVQFDIENSEKSSKEIEEAIAQFFA